MIMICEMERSRIPDPGALRMLPFRPLCSPCRKATVAAKQMAPPYKHHGGCSAACEAAREHLSKGGCGASPRCIVAARRFIV